VKWVEFPAGPQLLEGQPERRRGRRRLRRRGDRRSSRRPPAPASIYIGHDPAAPRAEAILVPKDSPIKSVADLKGKKVALNKGSNVHYLLVKLLEKNGLKLSDISRCTCRRPTPAPPSKAATSMPG
jgi:sulfonate transport system substrate-binding protein